MAVIGWCCCVIFLTIMTLTYCLCLMNNLGTYNIGGVPNSIKLKVVTAILGVAVLTLWFGVFWLKPFSIVITGTK